MIHYCMLDATGTIVATGVGPREEQITQQIGYYTDVLGKKDIKSLLYVKGELGQKIDLTQLDALQAAGRAYFLEQFNALANEQQLLVAQQQAHLDSLRPSHAGAPPDTEDLSATTEAHA